MSSTNQIYTKAVPSQEMKQLPLELASNISLVHRILMADPSEYVNLTITGDSRILSTPSYQEFEHLLNNNSNNSNNNNERRRRTEDQEGRPVVAIDFAITIKKAFRDQVCEKMQETMSIKPAADLLIELHKALRALIPSRQDLHGILQDSDVRNCQSREQLVTFCVKAAQSLSLLESEARAESTVAWIHLAQSRSAGGGGGDDDQEESPDQFLVTSLLYLLFKSELCAKDKEDFYFSSIWVPELARVGPTIARTAFEKQYGCLFDPSTAPATRQWLKSITRANGTDKLNTQIQIKKAWISDIVLRDKNAGNMTLPEIFYLDQILLQSIRMAVRMAVAGSALGIYACQAAGQSTDVLEHDLEPLSELDVRRTTLVKAMGERFKDEATYENDVAESVVGLARCWQPSNNLDAANEELLRSKTRRVLAADDSVVELLDGRMKASFIELLTLLSPPLVSTTTAPAEMRSGRSTDVAAAAAAAVSSSSGNSMSRKGAFLSRATSLFRSKGMTLFASDLALAAWNALRVIEVAILLYYDAIMEPSLRAG